MEDLGCKAYPPITKTVSQRLYEMAESLDAEQMQNEKLNRQIDALQAKLDKAKDGFRQIKELATYDIDHEEDGNTYQIEAIAQTMMRELDA